VGREVAQCQKCRYAFAALIFNKESDREWLRRKFTMDILEESWAYQEMVQKGLQQGLEKGLKKGRQEGELQAQRETLLDIVQARFPELVILAKKQMSNIKDPQILRHLTVKIQTANEGEQLLLALTKDQKKH
jgi:predicted transposase YdaD